MGIKSFSVLFQFQILCKSRTCATLCECFKSRQANRGGTFREGGVNEGGVARGKSGTVAGIPKPPRMAREKSGLVAGVSKARDRQGVAGSVTLDDVVLDMEGVAAGPRRVVTADDGEREKGEREEGEREEGEGEEDSVEWEVFNHDGAVTTASLRHRLFERSVSVQLEK